MSSASTNRPREKYSGDALLLVAVEAPPRPGHALSKGAGSVGEAKDPGQSNLFLGEDRPHRRIREGLVLARLLSQRPHHAETFPRAFWMRGPEAPVAACLRPEQEPEARWNSRGLTVGGSAETQGRQRIGARRLQEMPGPRQS